MARFLNRLQVEEVGRRGSGRWRLLAELVYYSDVYGHLIRVPVGFTTDFGSVPRLPLSYALFGNIARDAATVHDYAYTTHFVTRRVADAILFEAMRVTGVPLFQRLAWWVGVRLFGWSHWG